MDQEELENRVAEIWERQGFKVKQECNRFTVTKDGVEKKIQVFSSGEYSNKEVGESVAPGELVFVDEGLAELEQVLKNQVSVISS